MEDLKRSPTRHRILLADDDVSAFEIKCAVFEHDEFHTGDFFQELLVFRSVVNEGASAGGEGLVDCADF